MTMTTESVSASAAADTGANLQALPWPYKPLDPETTAERANEGFYKAECMYGVFESIAGATAERLRSPYKDFPFLMMKYGGGGINGWATVCGALAGGAAAFQLLSSDPGPLVDALFAWYETEALPDFYPQNAKFSAIKSISGTPLCHTSITEWCKAAKKHTYSPEQRELCGALAGSVARKAVLLLNDQIAVKPISAALPPATQNCLSCHGRGGVLQNTGGKMNCDGCHSVTGKHRSY